MDWNVSEKRCAKYGTTVKFYEMTIFCDKFPCSSSKSGNTIAFLLADIQRNGLRRDCLLPYSETLNKKKNKFETVFSPKLL